MVAVGGSRPVDGVLFYSNTNQYEHLLLDVRTRMLEAQDIRTRQSYKAVARNYGNIEEEMFAERDRIVKTPTSNANYNNPLGDGLYNLVQGTPLFVEQMFTNNTRFAGLVSQRFSPFTNSTASTIFIGTNRNDNPTQFHVGEEIEINGEQRTVQTYIPATANSPAVLTLANALSSAPPIGTPVFIKGREYANPHLNETYRVTDKYSSYIVDENRYQIDRNTGIIRYRPSMGNNGAASIWHPQDSDAITAGNPSQFLGVPYYFGRMIPVKTPPPPAGPSNDGIANNEELGSPTDPVSATASAATQSSIPGDGSLTNFVVSPPDGQYSNIHLFAPEGVAYEVELNGAKLAICSNGGSMIIPFFDPNYENDQLKANESIDPDIYIQRFIKAGENHLVIKATRTVAEASTGIIINGIFNGVPLTTGAITVGTAAGRTFSANSSDPSDWSASRHSILGIAGKVDFDLGDRIALEDSSDEIAKAQGVLESLTTLIAGTDINQFQSLLSVLK